MSKRFRFLEHTTDAEIEAFGSTLEEAFENAALALEETMVSLDSIKQTTNNKIELDGKDKDELLYKWLEALIIKQDTEGMLYSNFSCKISKKDQRLYLQAQAHGEKFDPEKHEQKTAVKAPTYHEMKIEEKERQVTLRFLLDL